jgi:hypothetical protein
VCRLVSRVLMITNIPNLYINSCIIEEHIGIASVLYIDLLEVLVSNCNDNISSNDVFHGFPK